MNNLEILVEHNKYRRGQLDHIAYATPTEVGIAIDAGISAMREVEALREELWVARRCGIKMAGEIERLRSEMGMVA